MQISPEMKNNLKALAEDADVPDSAEDADMPDSARRVVREYLSRLEKALRLNDEPPVSEKEKAMTRSAIHKGRKSR